MRRHIARLLVVCASIPAIGAFQVPNSRNPPRQCTSNSWRKTQLTPGFSPLYDRLWEPSDDLSLSLELNTTDLYSIIDASSVVEEPLHTAPAVDDTVSPPGPSSVLSEANMPLIMACLCWVVALLSALDRVAMSVAVLPMSEELMMSDTIKGQLSSFLSVGYGFGIIPMGLLVSRVSPRLLLGSGLALWSLSTMATPVASASDSLFLLYTVRAAVGVSESVVLPSVQRLVSNWVAPDRKSLAMAGIFSGFQCGTITAYLLSPWVMDELGGWRELFYVYGAAGLAWFIPWMLLSQDRPGELAAMQQAQAVEQADKLVQKASSAASLNAMETTGSAPATHDSSRHPESMAPPFQEAIALLKSAPWMDFLRSPGVWGMTLAHAANNWGLYNNLSWAPTFYSEQYGLSVRDSALLSVLPSVAGAIGGLAAGATADKFIRNMNANCNEAALTRIRKIYQSIALCGPALCLAVLASHIPEEPWVAQTLLTGTVGLQAFNAAGYGAANQEKAGEKWTGLLYGLTSLPGVMVGSYAVALTGQILDATQQDWSAVFGLNAVVDVLGAAAFVMLYSSKQEFD